MQAGKSLKKKWKVFSVQSRLAEAGKLFQERLGLLLTLYRKYILPKRDRAITPDLKAFLFLPQMKRDCLFGKTNEMFEQYII